MFNGENGYRVNVPQGATRLTIRLNTTTPNVNVDLYARFGADITAPLFGEVVADHFSVSPTGNETIVVTSASNPPLRAGTYFIGLRQFTTSVPVSGSITATVERAPTGTPTFGQELLPGQRISFSLPAVERPTLFGGSDVYRVNISQPGGFKIEVRTATPGADVDVHVRFLQPPAIENGRLASDFSATGDTGDEDLSVLPNLIGNRLGTYYVALALFSTGTPANGTIVMTPIAPGQQGDVKSLSLRLQEKGVLKPKLME
jgi:hypothetical protein